MAAGCAPKKSQQADEAQKKEWFLFFIWEEWRKIEKWETAFQEFLINALQIQGNNMFPVGFQA